MTIEDLGDFLRRSYSENWRLWCVGEGGSTVFAKREKLTGWGSRATSKRGVGGTTERDISWAEK